MAHDSLSMACFNEEGIFGGNERAEGEDFVESKRTVNASGVLSIFGMFFFMWQISNQWCYKQIFSGSFSIRFFPLMTLFFFQSIKENISKSNHLI